MSRPAGLIIFDAAADTVLDLVLDLALGESLCIEGAFAFDSGIESARAILFARSVTAGPCRIVAALMLKS